MWKVILVVCTLGNPCVIMEEDPIKHYQDYNECIKVAHEKHELIKGTLETYGYYIDKSSIDCALLPST
jgi:hypothetical protein